MKEAGGKRERREGGKREGREKQVQFNDKTMHNMFQQQDAPPPPVSALSHLPIPPPHFPTLPTTTPSVSIDLLLLDVCQQPHGPLLGPALVIHLPLLSNTLAADLTFLIEDGGGECKGEWKGGRKGTVLHVTLSTYLQSLKPHL